MSKKEEFDVDEELKKISRKTNVAAIKSQRSFENQIKKLFDYKMEIIKLL